MVESEAEFQATVIDLAQLAGWLVHHTRPAQNSRGEWRTPIAGDKGFPDLVLAHATKGVLLVELKSAKGRLTAEQAEWGDRLEPTGLYRVWRPDDWPAILSTLKHGPTGGGG